MFKTKLITFLLLATTVTGLQASDQPPSYDTPPAYGQVVRENAAVVSALNTDDLLALLTPEQITTLRARLAVPAPAPVIAVPAAAPVVDPYEFVPLGQRFDNDDQKLAVRDPQRYLNYRRLYSKTELSLCSVSSISSASNTFPISDAGLIAIAPHIPERLKCFACRYQRVGYDGLRVILPRLHRELDLFALQEESRSFIPSDAYMTLLVMNISRFRSLTALFLGINMDDAKLATLAPVIGELTELQRLDLRGNTITVDGFINLAPYISHKMLYFRTDENLSDSEEARALIKRQVGWIYRPNWWIRDKKDRY